MNNSPLHTFHIPVLGLCYSIDTPLKVARYGISSVVSIIEDELIEDMRAYHSLKNGLSFSPIPEKRFDSRAQRITAYLDMMHDLVQAQIAQLTALPFTEGSDMLRYFELLPTSSATRMKFEFMMKEKDGDEQIRLQEELRTEILPGAIDVNIMAKVDNPRYTDGGELMGFEFSDALSAFRGFANSKLSSSVVFSAGYNPRLYSYVEEFVDFFPDQLGYLRKKIILKVSDYRSALIQGKLLAKKGVWVSEFRVESGLNCGGHAFPTEGLLLGPILEEFRINRLNLREELYQLCSQAISEKSKPGFNDIPEQRISAQGGVGTSKEQSFLLEYFNLDSIGWGSPFLLVPEATNVDNETLQQLATAQQDDYYLSNASPLGVPFNNFRRSSSEAQRKARIEKNRAGSPCYKKYLSSNTEFTPMPICTASRQYQQLKEKQVRTPEVSEEEVQGELNKIMEKDCLCEGLTASVRLKNEMYLPHKLSAVSICPGPNLAYFSGVFSLKQIIDHIYGRDNIQNGLYRPNMFVNELRMYVDYLKNQITESTGSINDKQQRYFKKFKSNLLDGVAYYKAMLSHFACKSNANSELCALELQLSYLLTGQPLTIL